VEPKKVITSDEAERQLEQRVVFPVTRASSFDLLRGMTRVHNDAEEEPQQKRYENWSVDYSRWAGLARDQGAEGVCTAFSLTSALEISHAARFGYRVPLSVRHLWSFYSVPYFEVAVRGLKNRIVAVESAWPYENHRPLEGGLKGVNAGQGVRASSIENASVVNLTYIAERLKEGYGVALGMQTSPAFDMYKGAGLMDDRVGRSTGQHAVSVVGMIFSKDVPGGGYFKIKNSWGSQWGDNGFGYIPFRYCERFSCGAVTVMAASAFFVEGSVAFSVDR
jgi:C1A family cysteine protease